MGDTQKGLISEAYWEKLRIDRVAIARENLRQAIKIDQIEKDLDFRNLYGNDAYEARKIRRTILKKIAIPTTACILTFLATFGLYSNPYATLKRAQNKVVAKYGDLNSNGSTSQVERERLLENILWKHGAMKENEKQPMYMDGGYVRNEDYTRWINDYMSERRKADASKTPKTNLFLIR
jgi:hypothetical protein